MTPADLTTLVDQGDHDGLLRAINGCCERREWDALVDLRRRCDGALERGVQLWPIAAHIEYRLALESPAPWAVVGVREGAGRFTLGPLPEVVAAGHTWSDVAAHLDAGPAAGLVAHERVVRGEDLTETETDAMGVLEIPPRLQPWEPEYSLAVYESHAAHFPGPPSPTLADLSLPEANARRTDIDGTAALVDLVTPWTAESDGRADVATVEGGAAHAIAALGLRHARASSVDLETALAHLAWAGASGGAHGRRRGAATGRFGAWWVMAAIGGRLDDWPLHPDDLEATARSLHWWLWDGGEPDTGWTLRVAVEDPARDRAWAISAVDSR